jgi:NitT/TauT family transport system substrate-binding protein
VDPRTFGTGERIVFLPYTEEVFAATQQWAQAHQIFDGAGPSVASYREAAWA